MDINVIKTVIAVTGLAVTGLTVGHLIGKAVSCMQTTNDIRTLKVKKNIVDEFDKLNEQFLKALSEINIEMEKPQVLH